MSERVVPASKLVQKWVSERVSHGQVVPVTPQNTVSLCRLPNPILPSPLPCCHVVMLPCCHISISPCCHVAILPCCHMPLLSLPFLLHLSLPLPSWSRLSKCQKEFTRVDFSTKTCELPNVSAAHCHSNIFFFWFYAFGKICSIKYQNI